MNYYVCPECGNYTYDCSQRCPKCGFDFQYGKSLDVSVKNLTGQTVFYDFSYGAGLSIENGDTKIISIRESCNLTFFFHIADGDGGIFYFFFTFSAKSKSGGQLRLTLSERNGKFFCCW